MNELTHNGKNYRCLDYPTSSVGGAWEIKVNNKWFKVRNWEIKRQLNECLTDSMFNAWINGNHKDHENS